MGRLGLLLKYLFWLLVLGLLVLTGIALLSELPAPVRDVQIPLPLPGE
ncbi:MAG: hypothetical protein AAGI34_14770 [Pseudomonadota bacterium]